MAFAFRLEAVLEHRRHLQDLAFNAFAQRRKTQQECEQAMAWLAQELKRARQELTQREQVGILAKEYILANEYVTVIRLQLMRQQARLPMLKAQTDQARQALVEATRARKVLDKLKERHRAQWQRQELLAEQKLMDEVAVGGFLRRRTS